VQAQTIANFLETVTLGRSHFTELGPFFASLNRYKHSPNDSSRHGMLLPGMIRQVSANLDLVFILSLRLFLFSLWPPHCMHAVES
jgi:hypothetical protein